jgi:hypothetical protein
MLPAAMPDITKAQVIAGLKFVFTLAAMLALPVPDNTNTSAAKTPDTPPPPAFRDDAFTDVDPTQEDGIDLGDPAPESRPKAMSADEKAMTDLAGAEGGALRSGE